jgi:hypothetical protein
LLNDEWGVMSAIQQWISALCAEARGRANQIGEELSMRFLSRVKDSMHVLSLFEQMTEAQTLRSIHDVLDSVVATSLLTEESKKEKEEYKKLRVEQLNGQLKAIYFLVNTYREKAKTSSTWCDKELTAFQGVGLKLDLIILVVHRWLIEAILLSKIQYVRAILESGLVDINAVEPVGYTPLHAVIQCYNQEIFEYILNERPNVNQPADCGKKGEAILPIHLAAATGNLRVVKKLLSCGATIDGVTQSGGTVIHGVLTSGARVHVVMLIIAAFVHKHPDAMVKILNSHCSTVIDSVKQGIGLLLAGEQGNACSAAQKLCAIKTTDLNEKIVILTIMLFAIRYPKVANEALTQKYDNKIIEQVKVGIGLLLEGKQQEVLGILSQLQAKKKPSLQDPEDLFAEIAEAAQNPQGVVPPSRLTRHAM